MDIKFSMLEDDPAGFHDVLIDLADHFQLPFAEKDMERIFNALPSNIKFTAAEWGFSDTEFKDQAHVWILKNPQVFQ